MKVSCKDCKHYPFVKNYHQSGEMLMCYSTYPSGSENWCLQERVPSPTPIDASASTPSDIRVKNKDNDCAKFEEYIVPVKKNSALQPQAPSHQRPWWKFWA